MKIPIDVIIEDFFDNINPPQIDVVRQPFIPPMPPVKPSKKEKIQRIYEDDNFIIDLFTDEPTVRVSIFKDCHFVDEVFVRKENYENIN